METSVNQQNIPAKEKLAQNSFINSMTLNRLLTGLEPGIEQIIGARDSDDIITVSRIKCELNDIT